MRVGRAQAERFGIQGQGFLGIAAKGEQAAQFAKRLGVAGVEIERAALFGLRLVELPQQAQDDPKRIMGRRVARVGGDGADGIVVGALDGLLKIAGTPAPDVAELGHRQQN